MKLYKKPFCLILPAIIAALVAFGGFSACEAEDPVYVIGTEAVLRGMAIGTVPTRYIPSPIEEIDWEDQDHDVAGDDLGTLALNYALGTTRVRNVRFYPTVSRGARTEWGIGSASIRPSSFTDTRAPAAFAITEYVYIKVTSEDEKTVNYYRFETRLGASVIGLRSVIVDGKNMVIAGDGTRWNNAEEGDIALTLIQANRGVNIETTGTSDDASFRFAKVLKGTWPNADGPDFQDSNRMTFVDQDMLWIEVIAENKIDKAYFMFTVSVGRIATIAKLSLDSFEVVGKGLPNAVWGDVLAGSFATAWYDQPTDGFTINIEKDDPEATIQYGIMDAVTSGQPAYSSSGKKEIGNGKVLAIKVTSHNGIASMYYKVKIALEATKFIQQPRSTAYYYYRDGNNPIDRNEYLTPEGQVFTSDTPEPLDFRLDREGDYTYQWWEANSWYGGYGFDKDGRIVLDNGTQEGIPPPDFQADTEHSIRFDEKMNVSLFNGGNQAARYVVPGRPIPGETGRTYTPRIDYRPFLPGYSNETHYYWVVITDDRGYTLTSARAYIVSERNKAIEHYIIDTNNYTDTAGNKVSFRNDQPFKEKYDKYRIPLKFEAGFNINDYTVATAQATFFLVDGTPWVQNWTQGNLSFENNANPNIDQYGDVGNILVLFYNLTNNNGGYMLASDSKEPVGIPLVDNPTHVVIEPSGDHTKRGNGFPPLNSEGKADSSIVGKDMQGWFCGFIDLVELRFEGPAR